MAALYNSIVVEMLNYMSDACYKALADGHRRRILAALCRRAIRAGDLARLVGLAPNTLSFHLRSLLAAGLVTATRQGRCLWYEAAQDAVGRWLADVAAQFGEPTAGPRPTAPEIPAQAVKAKPKSKDSSNKGPRPRRRKTPSANALRTQRSAIGTADSVPDDILLTELL